MGVKFEHDGDHRAIFWFSIEQTTQERRSAARVSGIVRGLVKHLVEVGKKNEVNAKQHIDSDYKRASSYSRSSLVALMWMTTQITRRG